MFDELKRELRKLERGVQIQVSMPVDEHGYFDRVCPWHECGFQFKVLFDDWVHKVPDAAAYCPFCRHQARPQRFDTREQARYLERVANSEVQRAVDRGLRRSAQRFNRSAPSGFITKRPVQAQGGAS